MVIDSGLVSTSWKPRGARYCVSVVLCAGRRYIIVRLAAWGWHAPPGASFPAFEAWQSLYIGRP